MSTCALLLVSMLAQSPGAPAPGEASAAAGSPGADLPVPPAFAAAEHASCSLRDSGRHCYFSTRATPERVVEHYAAFARSGGWKPVALPADRVENARLAAWASGQLRLRVEVVDNPLTGGEDVFVHLVKETPRPAQPGSERRP